MKRLTTLSATAMLLLAGCDQIPFLQGDKVEVSGNAASSNASTAGNGSTSADAGITSSRSLAGLTGGATAGQSGEGGKDPSGAIPAGSRGGIDPRLVGRWSDDGSCKDVVELHADGTFTGTNGGNGRWAVDGDQLVFWGPGGEVRLQLNSVGSDRIVNTDAQGNTGQTTRC